MECSEPTDLMKHYLSDGWKIQFSASGSSLGEMVVMYESMGLEVKTLPYTEAVCGGCTICYDGELEGEQTMMILTREITTKLRAEKENTDERTKN